MALDGVGFATTLQVEQEVNEAISFRYFLKKSLSTVILALDNP